MGLCWQDKEEWIIRKYGEYSDEHLAMIADDEFAICMLPRCHDGPHEWTPDDEIVVHFHSAK